MVLAGMRLEGSEMSLTDKQDRILDDLRNDLDDWAPDGETWEEAVETALTDAWDALLKAGAPA